MRRFDPGASVIQFVVGAFIVSALLPRPNSANTVAPARAGTAQQEAEGDGIAEALPQKTALHASADSIETPHSVEPSRVDLYGRDWYFYGLQHYALFSGRARRKEFWQFVAFNYLFAFLASILGGVFGAFVAATSGSADTQGVSTGAQLGWSIFIFATLIPTLAVSVRRLHDTGKSGFWLFLSLVPVVGFILLLIFWMEDSEAGTNQYGPNPKAVE